MNAINGKANASHTHNATDITYKSGVNVKQELDNINQQLDIVDSQGNKINILSVLFGVGAAVGTAIDGGLVAAVSSLQTQTAALQAQMASLIGESLASDALEAFDEVGDVVGGSSSSVISRLGSWANCFSRLRASIQGYSQVSTVVANPLAGAVVL